MSPLGSYWQENNYNSNKLCIKFGCMSPESLCSKSLPSTSNKGHHLLVHNQHNSWGLQSHEITLGVCTVYGSSFSSSEPLSSLLLSALPQSPPPYSPGHVLHGLFIHIFSHVHCGLFIHIFRYHGVNLGITYDLTLLVDKEIDSYSSTHSDRYLPIIRGSLLTFPLPSECVTILCAPSTSGALSYVVLIGIMSKRECFTKNYTIPSNLILIKMLMRHLIIFVSVEIIEFLLFDDIFERGHHLAFFLC